ncbi:conserved hypothetical integral membrane protein [Geoglobus ahangari]|uniref:Probable queuosine precursor transporter n=1 Tax=Geoglobus ahangari TaxID=113653 RepID=A0A0F7IFW8_9EURY|nr:queuosine precursor transporter [Geoglobus ahangari]AKG90782.1 conserved hypothetical integral membrane protein [Geoglobus ahangari]NOY11670.1 queuosine precursor transporter [Archaeoglobi archaeon]
MLLQEFVAWTLVTLAAVTLTIAVARRFGVEVIIGVYAVLTVVANIVAVKLISVASVVAPAGVIVYAITFLITDFISEVYGKEAAKKAVITGLTANIVYLLSIYAVLQWTPAPFVGEEFERAFNQIFGLTPRIVFASLLAFAISQTNDVYVFHLIRERTSGKHLWIRNNASTAMSQLIDTAVFITVAFYGIAPVWELIVGQYLLKLLIALLDTPFLYAGVMVYRALKPNVNVGEG